MCAGCQESWEMLNKADFFPFHWPSRVGQGHYGFFLQASFWLDGKSGACSMNKKITRSKACHNGHFAETKIFPRRSRDWGQNVLSSNTQQQWVGEDLAGPLGLITSSSKETERKHRPLWNNRMTKGRRNVNRLGVNDGHTPATSRSGLQTQEFSKAP